MTPYRNRLKTPEEVELDLKREKLAQCREELGLWKQAFNNLRSEIREFEARYQQVLGNRISELEDLEWQLNGLLGKDEIEREATSAAREEQDRHFDHKTDLLDDDEDAAVQTRRGTLKGLYREVAKAVHPDLAVSDEDRQRRQELMSIANQAYQSGDRRTLEELLSDWERGPEAVSGEDVAAELVRVIRMIDRVQQEIHAVIRQMDELKTTDIYGFKVRVDEACKDGIDLMSEMAATVDLDIAKIRRRLAALHGEEDTQDELKFAETRIIHFPGDISCGMLFERNRGSVDYRDWKRLGRACGNREVFLDKAIRLDVHGSATGDPAFLDSLQPDDLQALFMYDVDDGALKHLGHLTGLEELYLSNTTVSDAGLARLQGLTGLKRLYIYHTAISDRGLDNLARLKGLKWLTCSGTAITEAGLNSFRHKLPGCKAVSFEWRHGK
ncbi:MAG TPA: hypothetical protein PLN25_04815 [Deltaproteobacteria bacterium]|nr:hypothetical protein [Deltaproteobacteria bacterium]HQB38958.1 hypothetical protein [Deltaproteobacteria bacterium]